MNQVFIGHDSRELDAYQVCVDSMRKRSKVDPIITPISSKTLGNIYTRPETTRDGVRYDVISGAPMATEFSLARFFVPYLARKGWAIFCDCDFLWRADVNELFALADPRYAIQVVAHPSLPSGPSKMDGQPQLGYARKNWSSLILFNCEHPSVHLPLAYLNSARGLELHQFDWVSNELIGKLPWTWNWLCGVEPLPVLREQEDPKAVHFTLGVPSMPGYEKQPYADEWSAYAANR
jgi:hypothetical protein